MHSTRWAASQPIPVWPYKSEIAAASPETGGSFLDKVELIPVGLLSLEVKLEKLIIMVNLGNGEGAMYN